MKKYNLKQQYVRLLENETAINTHHISVSYDDLQSIFDVSLSFPRFKITALIGSSGSGKSTFLRSINRMNDGIATVQGKIMYRDVDINAEDVNVYELRKHIGMVFQRPNPFAKSIRENIIFSLRQNGIKNSRNLNERLETSLKEAALWDEVKNKLDTSALSLSGGQSQRLCIARAIAMQPDVLLLDEPASALDPISTAKIEDTLTRLKKHYTIIIVTHNMQQASRISDYTAFFHQGHLIEFDSTKNIFTRPKMVATEDYISGNFG